MKLTISKQLQAFIESLGMRFEQFLAESDIPNYMWKEELTVSNEAYIDYYKQWINMSQMSKY